LEGNSPRGESVTAGRHERPAQHPTPPAPIVLLFPRDPSPRCRSPFFRRARQATRRQCAANGDIALHVLRNRSGAAGVPSAKVWQRFSREVVQEFGPLGRVREVPRHARAVPRCARMQAHDGRLGAGPGQNRRGLYAPGRGCQRYRARGHAGRASGAARRVPEQPQGLWRAGRCRWSGHWRGQASPWRCFPRGPPLAGACRVQARRAFLSASILFAGLGAALPVWLMPGSRQVVGGEGRRSAMSGG
jgi:hypothetical protein